MTSDHADFASMFRELTDDELLRRYGCAMLTDAAAGVALAEINARGLEVPEPPLSAQEPIAYAGDYEVVARYLNPTDAYVVRACLEMAGIPALIADAQLVQTNSLWAVALGGARLLVPAAYLAEAGNVIAAFNRGEYSLTDDDESTP